MLDGSRYPMERGNFEGKGRPVDDSGGSKEPCIRWGSGFPWEGAILSGEEAAHCKV